MLAYISDQYDRHHQLCHASNLIGKWYDGMSGKKMSDTQANALFDIISNYYEYLKANTSLIGFEEVTVRKRVDLLNTYYNFFFENGYDNVFPSQSKFRPTILEEFMFLLFRDYVDYLRNEYGDSEGVIGSGAAKAYTNLYFSSRNFESFVKEPSIEINLKDQDFAIYRAFQLTINGVTKDVRIPVVSVENKTYIDKTMLEGIIATAEKIKTGNPYSLFIAVTENYDVDLKVDPAYSRIDQIYVLRKSKRKELWRDISFDVVWRMFDSVKNHIERPWSDVEQKMRNDGVII